MPLSRVAHLLGSRAEQQLKDLAQVVRRPAAEEVVRGLAPRLAQPGEVRLEAAGGGNQRARPHLLLHAVAQNGRAAEAPSVDGEVHGLGVVRDVHAERFGHPVVRVHQRLAATEEKRVGARELQRAAERRLEANAVPHHPFAAGRGVADHAPREALVGLATRDLEQVLPVLLLGIGFGQDVGGRVVHASQVARVAAVAAAEVDRRRLHHEHARPRLTRGDRRAERRVSAAQHEHVPCPRQIHCVGLYTPGEAPPAEEIP